MNINYPDIMGIKLSLSLNEANTIVSNLGYDKFETIHNFEGWYRIKSKTCNNRDLIAIFILNDSINRIIIKNWKEFFGFINSDIKFADLINIFDNYFLKSYNYNSYFNDESKTLKYYNRDWIIYFDNKYKEIDISKERLFND